MPSDNSPALRSGLPAAALIGWILLSFTAALPGARPWSFGVGHLWKIACLYDGSPVPPCVHRAPPTIPGQPPRLLLIS